MRAFFKKLFLTLYIYEISLNKGAANFVCIANFSMVNGELALFSCGVLFKETDLFNFVLSSLAYRSLQELTGTFDTNRFNITTIPHTCWNYILHVLLRN